jgi:hypothetical protein
MRKCRGYFVCRQSASRRRAGAALWRDAKAEGLTHSKTLARNPVASEKREAFWTVHPPQCCYGGRAAALRRFTGLILRRAKRYGGQGVEVGRDARPARPAEVPPPITVASSVFAKASTGQGGATLPVSDFGKSNDNVGLAHSKTLARNPVASEKREAFWTIHPPQCCYGGRAAALRRFSLRHVKLCQC